GIVRAGRTFHSELYGSFAPGGVMTMSLYRNAVCVEKLIRESGGDEIRAYGHGFISDTPIDRIEFSLQGPTDEVMIGAFVGLDSGESTLGSTTIPGYDGPHGSVIPYDFGFSSMPELGTLAIFVAGLSVFATRSMACPVVVRGG